MTTSSKRIIGAVLPLLHTKPDLKIGHLNIGGVFCVIRSLDTNHMVSIGDEGFRVDGSTAEPHSWINTGYEGVDMTCNIKNPSVDVSGHVLCVNFLRPLCRKVTNFNHLFLSIQFATVHSYVRACRLLLHATMLLCFDIYLNSSPDALLLQPDSWGIGANEYQWIGPNFIDDRAALAHSINKPVVLEEYGMRTGYLPSRDTLFNYELGQANSADYACTLVWAVAHYPTNGDPPYGSNDGQGYVFEYNTDGSNSTLAQYSYMQAKNAAQPPVPSPPPIQSPGPTPPPVGLTPIQLAPPSLPVPCPPSPPPAAPACVDIPPPGNSYTCAQQKSWGKWSVLYMLYVLRSV